ncbi:MAG: AraC family transcriptional regulator [Lachnospiraceae bacterium]|nr:AraC family transcriptional regulator [Lachnospiraceae bacterium]
MNKKAENSNNYNISDELLREKKEHGNLEYPIAVYTLNLHKMISGFVRWHWHEEMELSLVIKGSAQYKVGNDTFLLKENDAILINQNVLHSVYPVPGEPCSLQVLVFHPAYLFGYGETYMCTKYLTPVVGNNSLKSLLLNDNSTFSFGVRHYASLILECNLRREYGYELATKGYLCSLWMHILEYIKALPDALPVASLTSDEARAKQAMLYIQEHYTENLTLDEIAEAIHLSKSECCRCMKRTLQLTPFEYLIKFRIFAATLMIMQQKPAAESISALAHAVGFNSASYFNKCFKNLLFCTPTEYKKNLKENGYLTSDLEHYINNNIS